MASEGCGGLAGGERVGGVAPTGDEVVEMRAGLRVEGAMVTASEGAGVERAAARQVLVWSAVEAVGTGSTITAVGGGAARSTVRRR